MNRNIFLILSAVTVVVLLAVWVYLLFFSNQTQGTQEPIQETGAFNEFNLGTDATTPPNQDNGLLGADELDVTNEFGYDPEILRQLTTKNVAGYSEVLYASTTMVYFMESGVGHIYSINLSTGEESRISATTIPNAREASFSLDGQHVAVKVGKSAGPNTLLFGAINHEELTVSTNEVAGEVTQFSFTTSGTLQYSALTNVSAVGYEFNNISGTSDILFTTPFREADVVFTKDADVQYVFPKTSARLEGFVYKIENGVTSRLQLDGFGLSANGNSDAVVISKRDSSDYTTNILSDTSDSPALLSKAFIPSKCLLTEKTFCAGDNSILKYDSHDNWLKGVDTFSDSLWELNDSQATKLIDIEAFSGRAVDVINNQSGAYSNDWYFKNKLDDSLWIFELSSLEETNN